MRTFLLGMDGATFDLILPWARNGQLPNFSRLLKRSYFGELSSLPPITPAGWTSIITGVNCGKHGLADFFKIDRRNYQLRLADRTDRKASPIYDMLGKRGKKVAILNYPMTYPAEAVNGWLVTGLQTPEVNDRSSHPGDLIRELKRELDDIVFMTHYEEGQSLDDFLGEIKRLTEARRDMILHFIRNHDLDLLATVFMGPDIVSHNFWKYMDGDHPDHGNIAGEKRERFKDAILEIYAQIDAYLGEFLEALKGKNTAIVLVSDHGSGPLYGYVNLNRHLYERGHLSLDKEKRSERGKMVRAVSKLLKGVLKRVPALEETVEREREREREKAGPGVGVGVGGDESQYFQDVVWERTAAYSWGNLSSVSLNLEGREALGIVPPERAGEMREEVARSLRKLRGEDGEKLVDEIRFAEDVFRGPHVKELPDIYLIMRGITYLGRGVNPVYRDIMGRPVVEPADISGTHRVNGIYAVSDICAQERFVRRAGELKLKGREYKVFDIAPTVLRIFNAGIPGYFDGEVMEEAFI